VRAKVTIWLLGTLYGSEMKLIIRVKYSIEAKFELPKCDCSCRVYCM